MTSSTWGWGEGFAAAKFAALFNHPYRPELVDDPRLVQLVIERAIGILWHDQELGKESPDPRAVSSMDLGIAWRIHSGIG